MRSIRTDLASEARELTTVSDGVVEEVENKNGVRISRIDVTTKDAQVALGKAMGRYITIDAPDLAMRDTAHFGEVSAMLSDEIAALLFKHVDKSSCILIVGLGNRYITPDALGPRVVEKTFVTKHIVTHMPDIIGETMRPVAAMAPGVLGITGMETLDVVKGLVDNTKPDALIVIDALCSRRASRINTTIQLCDTGIAPGSGVGNLRDGINEESLGVPVLAIGVPTVVMGETISQDTIRLIAEETGLHNDEEKLIDLASKVIETNYGSLIVTPKDIDTIISDMAGIIAKAINIALHKPYYDKVEELLA